MKYITFSFYGILIQTFIEPLIYTGSNAYAIITYLVWFLQQQQTTHN